MKPWSLFLISLNILLMSCSQNTGEQKKTGTMKDPVVLKENFSTGNVMEKIVCRNDSSQSYAMYLPTVYSSDKLFPIIIAFDAHARGSLPVGLYKGLAEQYGYIIIGSNNSRNGIPWEESRRMAGKLFADLAARLSIDLKRIYLMGFSGGARIANAITIENGSIAGVICCGAAAPAANFTNPRNDYTFLGMVGTEDFNYLELKRYNMIGIAGRNVKHGLITYSGKHEWPLTDIMDEGFWWLELNEMRKNFSHKNDTLINKRLGPIINQIKKYEQTNEPFKAYRLCLKTINFYDGLADLSYCYNLYKSFQSNPEIDMALKNEEAMWKKEENLKNHYVQALQRENLSWWQKDIALVNKKITMEKNEEEKLILKRTLSYLSLLCYMQTTGALQQNNVPAAEHFCKLYMLIDPANSEAYYLMAGITAKQGKNQDAIKLLNKAVENGFTDKERLRNDRSFSGIKNSEEYKTMVK